MWLFYTNHSKWREIIFRNSFFFFRSVFFNDFLTRRKIPIEENEKKNNENWNKGTFADLQTDLITSSCRGDTFECNPSVPYWSGNDNYLISEWVIKPILWTPCGKRPSSLWTNFTTLKHYNLLRARNKK